jgi:hypothetical protein
MNATDEQVMRTLIEQVLLAMSAVQDKNPMASKRDVVTFVTRPMWEAFCRAAGITKNSAPAEWKGVKSVRICGSETHIVESGLWWCVSMPRACDSA